MPDEFINYHWIFDAGDDPDVAAVALADLDVHVENALLAPRLRLIAARRSTRLGPAVSSSVQLFPHLDGATCARCTLLGRIRRNKFSGSEIGCTHRAPSGHAVNQVKLRRGSGTNATSRSMEFFERPALCPSG